MPAPIQRYREYMVPPRKATVFAGEMVAVTASLGSGVETLASDRSRVPFFFTVERS
jgi:hypothetical protein